MAHKPRGNRETAPVPVNLRNMGRWLSGVALFAAATCVAYAAAVEETCTTGDTVCFQAESLIQLKPTPKTETKEKDVKTLEQAALDALNDAKEAARKAKKTELEAEKT